ncbi:MAG: MFS transporter, partial [Leifsonia xyli]
MQLAAAVAVGALIGPSQVGARVVEMLVGERLHPTATLACAGALVAVGIVLLACGAGPAAVAVMFYAAGNGVWSIARGTVPLALFGPERYSVVMGRLAAPNLVVQAAAPFSAGLVIFQVGTETTLAALATVAAMNLVATTILVWRRQPER